MSTSQNLLVFAVCLAVSLPVADKRACAQNPFERPARAPVAGQPQDAGGPAAAETDPVIKSILGSDVRTPVQLIRTTEVLMDLSRDDLAIGYLQRLNDLVLTDQQLFDLYREAGADLIFRFSTRDELDPVGKIFSSKVIAAADRYSKDAARMQQLTTQIGDPDIEVRSAAMADLRLLGEEGAAAIVNALADESQRDAWPKLRGALRYFQRSAEGPLLAALRSNDARMRLEAIQALGDVSTSASVESLFVPALSVDERTKELARRSLIRLSGRVPSAGEIEVKLYRAVLDHLQDRIVLDRTPSDVVRWWRWDNDTGRLSSIELTALAIARIRAFHRAADLVSLKPDRVEYRHLYWLARLESTKLAYGLDAPLPEEALLPLAQQIESETLVEVLEMALAKNRLPAAIAACEVIANNGHEGMLFSEGDSSSPLIDAIRSGSSRLAHAAAQAIFSINPSQPFAGSSRYIDSLVQAARSRGQRKALIGHSDAAQARTLSVLVSRSGYVADVALTARRFYDQAVQDPDLELLILTDRLDKPNIAELVQSLRNHPRTQRLPILLLFRSERQAEAELIARTLPRVVAMPLVFEDSLVARQIDNAVAVNDYSVATSTERLGFARSALDQLEHIASNPQRYSFYDLASREKALEFPLHTPSLALQTCKILGQLATPDAQRNLAIIAANDQLPEELRRAAAEAFSTAVKSRGLLLTRAEILTQYDQYNASSDRTPGSRQILGSILDAMESKDN